MLKFPTMAMQAVTRFKTSLVTISLATIAKEMGAVKEKIGLLTIYVFDDDTSISVSGRGKSHKIVTHLP